MKAQEIRKKSAQELLDLQDKLTKEYQDLVKGIIEKKEKNVRKPRELRKDIARIQTILNERKILEGESEEKSE